MLRMSFLGFASGVRLSHGMSFHIFLWAAPKRLFPFLSLHRFSCCASFLLSFHWPHTPTLTPILPLPLLLFKLVHCCCPWTVPLPRPFHLTVLFRSSSWIYGCTGKGMFAVHFLNRDCQGSSDVICKEWLMFVLLSSAASSPGSTSGRREGARFLFCTNPGFYQCPTLEAAWLSWVSGSSR